MIVGESENVELDSRDANQAVFFCADEQELRNVTLINREGSDGLATQNSGEKEEGDKRTFTIEETRIANHRHEALKDYVRSPSVTSFEIDLTIYANRCYWYDGESPVVGTDTYDEPQLDRASFTYDMLCWRKLVSLK